MSTSGRGSADSEAAERERQFSPSAYSPNHELAIRDGHMMSEAFRARERVRARYDVAYGASPAETMDLFLPEPGAGTSCPIEMYIHGGFWRARDKRDFSYLAEPVVAAGGVCAIVNYGLCPAVTIDEIVRQMRAAVAWLWHNADAQSGDRNRIHVTGHSAGGHLTAMMAATEWPRVDPALPRDAVKTIFALSGIFDLRPVRQISVQKDVRLTEDMAVRNSPLLLPVAPLARAAVAVGGAESPEFRRQSRDYAAHLSAHGASVDHFEVPAKDHFRLLTESLAPGDPVTATRLALMGL